MAGDYSKFSSDLDSAQSPAEPEDLSSVVKRGQEKIAGVASKGDPSSPLEDDAANHYMGQLQQLNDQYSPSAPPQSRKALADALDRAKQLYDDKASRNEWLEVAQILGRAGTQYAAAQAGMASGGKYGRNMAGLDFGPGVDYNARTERAARDYAQEAKNLGDVEEANRRDFEAGSKANETKYNRGRDLNEKGLSAALREEEIRRQASADDKRFNRGQKAEKDREDFQLRNLKAKDLDQAIKDKSQQLTAGQALQNNEGIDDDLSSKDASKLQAKYGDLAGRAGIDLVEVAKDAEKAPQVDKKFLGMVPYKGDDPNAKSNALKTRVDKIRQELEQLKQQKASLLNRDNNQPSQGGVGTPTTSGNPQTPPPPSTVKVKGPSGQVAEMTPENAKKYLSKPGYSQVP